MYFIELIATKQCNQNCYYCTTKTKIEGRVEVDVDYLKWVLDQCPSDLGVEMTGGEIGLLSNLDEFYITVRDHPHVKHIMALSNGLLRQIGVDWLSEVEYWEHLVHDIVGKDVQRFYPMDLKQDHKYIIVATKITTRSLLKHWEYFKEAGIFNDNFFYKIMNHKSRLEIDYADDLIDLYTRLGDNYSRRMAMTYKLNNYLQKERDRCQKFSPNPFVDLQEKKLGHCAINVNQSTKVDFNEHNLRKLMNGELSENSYCQKCHAFDDGQDRRIENNRSYKNDSKSKIIF